MLKELIHDQLINYYENVGSEKYIRNNCKFLCLKVSGLHSVNLYLQKKKQLRLFKNVGTPELLSS